MGAFTGVLAHQGGWDEVLLVAAPVALFVVLLRVANQRAAAAEQAEQAEQAGRTPDLDDPTPDDR